MISVCVFSRDDFIISIIPNIHVIITIETLLTLTHTRTTVAFMAVVLMRSDRVNE